MRLRVFPLATALLALIGPSLVDGRADAAGKTSKAGTSLTRRAVASATKKAGAKTATTTTWPGRILDGAPRDNATAVDTIPIPGVTTTLPLVATDPASGAASGASASSSGATVTATVPPLPVISLPPPDPTAAGTPPPASGDAPLPVISTTTTASTTTLPTKRVIEIVGHGYGHGRGLGQWGAFGYATDFGWTSAQILSHFYPGTGAGRVAPTSAIGVRLLAQEGKVMTVYQPKGLLFVGPDGAALDLAGAPAAAHGASAGASAGVPAGQAAGGDTTVPVPSGFLASGGGALTAQASAPAPIPTASPSVSGPSASVATPDGPAAVRIKLTAKGTFTIADGPGCDGPFVDRSAPIKASAVVVSAAADRSPSASDDPKDLLQLCGTSGRTVYRGDLLAVDDAASGQAGQHTVNQLRLEPYLRSVVPSEVPKSWGATKGGIEALKAQAVAARSYAAAERRTGYSNTCDNTACQMYKGRGEYRSGGAFVTFEDPRTDQAVADTAGEVRVEPKTGAPIRTEFSSSTGGYTAPGDQATAVPDEGDATAGNPYKLWTVTLDATKLDGKFGALTAIDATKRDGFGPDGGRVKELTLTFTKGTSTLSASDFVSRFGLRSSLFTPQLKFVARSIPLSSDSGPDTLPGGSDDPTAAAAAGAAQANGTNQANQANPANPANQANPSTTAASQPKKPTKDPAPRKGTTTIVVKRPSP